MTWYDISFLFFPKSTVTNRNHMKCVCALFISSILTSKQNKTHHYVGTVQDNFQIHLIVISCLVIPSKIIHSNQAPQCPSKRLGHFDIKAVLTRREYRACK